MSAGTTGVQALPPDPANSEEAAVLAADEAGDAGDGRSSPSLGGALVENILSPLFSSSAKRPQERAGCAPAAATPAASSRAVSPVGLFTGGPLTLDTAAPFTHTGGLVLRGDSSGDSKGLTPTRGQQQQQRDGPAQGTKSATGGGLAPRSKRKQQQQQQQHSGKQQNRSLITLRCTLPSRYGSAPSQTVSGSAAALKASHAQQQQQGTRITLAPSALLAAHSTDPRQWVLAIRRETKRIPAASGSSDSPPHLSKQVHPMEEGEAGTTAVSTKAAAAAPAPSTTHTVPALEEKLTLADLKRLMHGFTSETQVSDEELLDRQEQEAREKRRAEVTAATSAGHLHLHSPALPHTPEMESSDERRTSAHDGAWNRGESVERVGGAESHQPALHSLLPQTAAELTSLLAHATVQREGPINDVADTCAPQTDGAAHGRAEAREDGQRHSRRQLRSAQPSAAITTATSATPVSFERVLNKEEFIALMRGVLAANPIHHAAAASDAGATAPPLSVSDEEIYHLLDRVDYDSHGTVTWNELATFFICQSQHRTHLAHMTVQYSEKPEPATCASVLERHQRGITCYTIAASKKIIITGSMDGTARAWGIRSLAHRGLVFSCPENGWLVGAHYGFLGRVLYLVTMDRKIYVLEGNTFEVLRSFQGRPVDDTSESVVYAHDTTRMVRVGGVGPPAPTARASTGPIDGAGGSRMQQRADEQRRLQQQRYLRKKAAEGAGALASLQMGQSQGEAAGAAATAVMTTEIAFETLDLDNAQLTMRGGGPYAERRIHEDVIVGLVDAITATAFHFSALEEETLLLGTTRGDVYIVVIPAKATTKVLVPKHVLPRLHSDAINKLELLPAMDALVSCAEDGKVIMTSLVTGKMLRVFHAPGFHDQHVAVRDFAVNAPLRMIVTVGPERSGLVWDFTQAQPVAVLDAHNSGCNACAIVAPTDSLASAGDAGVAAGMGRASLPPPHIITCGTDGSVFMFDVNGFHRVQAIRAGPRPGGNGGAGDGGGSGGPVDFTDAPEHADAARRTGNNDAVASRRGRGHADVDHVPLLIVPDMKQRSVLCFSRYVYRLRMKRQATAACPARYSGHVAPMLSVLYTRSFDMLVTVDTDAMAMTWHRRNGRNIFAFSLGEFSESATLNATKLTAVALDGTQRRMLTGFRNGAVVVWNVVNGQALNFITAGMSDELVGHNAGEDGQTRGGGSAHQPGGGGGSSREVTAISSLLRHNVVFLLFAIGAAVHVVQENTSSFTIASRFNSWTLPPVYGEVSAMLQVSPQMVACGTTSGALLFFHVLSGRQEGAALWVRDAAPSNPFASSAAGGQSARHKSVCHGNGGGGRPSMANLGANLSRLHSIGAAPLSPTHRLGSTVSVGGPSAGMDTTFLNTTTVTTRIVKLLALSHVHPQLLLAIHVDGTVALWHALRRVYLGSVSLSAARRRNDRSGSVAGGGGDGGSFSRQDDGVGGPAEDGEDDVRTIVADVNAQNNTLAFADEQGAIHVCEIGFRPLPVESEEERRALDMANPALFAPAMGAPANPAAPAPPQHPPPSPRGTRAPLHTDAQGKQARDRDRQIMVFDRFVRVRVFPSGLTSINHVLLVDSTAADLQRQRHSDSESIEERAEARTPCPVVVCCSSDSQFSRVFTLDGLPVGEPGMDPWDLGDTRTYRYMGERVVPPSAAPENACDGHEGSDSEEREQAAASDDTHSQAATPTSASGDGDVFFDYLADARAALQQQQRQACLSSIRRVAPGRSIGGRHRHLSAIVAAAMGGSSSSTVSHASVGTAAPTPTAAGVAQNPSLSLAGSARLAVTAAAEPTALRRNSSRTAVVEDTPGAAGPLSREARRETVAAATPANSVPLAVPMKQFYNTGTRPLPGVGSPAEASDAVGAVPHATAPAISTLMTRNTKDTPAFGRVLKAPFAQHIRAERHLRMKQQKSSTSGTPQREKGSDFPLAFADIPRISVTDSEKSCSSGLLAATDREQPRKDDSGRAEDAGASQDAASRSQARSGRLGSVGCRRSPVQTFLACLGRHEAEPPGPSRGSSAGVRRPSTGYFRDAVDGPVGQRALPAAISRPGGREEGGTEESAGERAAAPSASGDLCEESASDDDGDESTSSSSPHELSPIERGVIGGSPQPSFFASTSAPAKLPPLSSPAPHLTPSSPAPGDGSRAPPRTGVASASAPSHESGDEGDRTEADGEAAIDERTPPPTTCPPPVLPEPRPPASTSHFRKPPGRTKVLRPGAAAGVASNLRRRQGDKRPCPLRLFSAPLKDHSERVAEAAMAAAASPTASTATPRAHAVTVTVASPTDAAPRRPSLANAAGALLSPARSPGVGAAAAASEGTDRSVTFGDVSSRAAAALSPQHDAVMDLLEGKRVEVLRNLGGSAAVAGTGDAAVLLMSARDAANTSGTAAGGTGPRSVRSETSGAAGAAAATPQMASPATSDMTARSFIAAVSARMYVAPVEDVEPPLGSRSREEAEAWREHLRRLQEGKSATAVNVNALPHRS